MYLKQCVEPQTGLRQLFRGMEVSALSFMKDALYRLNHLLHWTLVLFTQVVSIKRPGFTKVWRWTKFWKRMTSRLVSAYLLRDKNWIWRKNDDLPWWRASLYTKFWVTGKQLTKALNSGKESLRLTNCRNVTGKCLKSFGRPMRKNQ
jgi:hypothetical protein